MHTYVLSFGDVVSVLSELFDADFPVSIIFSGCFSSSLDDDILRFFLTIVFTGDDSGLKDFEKNLTMLCTDLL